MAKRVFRPGVREGYDRWAASYDDSPNPLVALDRRYTLGLLAPRPGERILDAGCGTGVHIQQLRSAGSRPLGLDFSRGMLRLAQGTNRDVPLVQADLNADLPLKRGAFDAVLCALVSEHITQLQTLFSQAFVVLKQGGRLVVSAFHPQAAASGIEANFEQDGTEYRLGAEQHTIADYLERVRDAGFTQLRWREYRGDAELEAAVPGAGKYGGSPLLLTIQALRPHRGC
ncbi:MAG: methyltransferase domain-containing protein [Candidatus Latescibacterota bacterium]|nr:MAG: methyltransferase domain-containing protein [Candidatus Latescibacterota bacterium]